MKQLSIVCLVLLTFFASAQDLSAPIPMDEAVKSGKLDNGLTYYLRKNSYPENRAQLRLVVNAGSMQEDKSQLGLAHFIEHMAFNGSTNFEKNDLVDFLQSIGVEFGADLNAYTSFDETVYILPLPTDDEEVLMKGLTVLEDWAGGIAFSDEEIDKERGVIIEEWRIGQGAQQRMRDQYFPVLFQGSRYAERLPIGKKDIIENAPYDELKRFYKDWYRPDLMAVVVVGDVDLDQMEKEIKKRFSKLKPVKKPRQKESNTVPAHKETLVSVTKDAENPYTIIQMIYKRPSRPVKTQGDFRNSYLKSIYNRMLNARLSELTQTAQPPFLFASSNFGSFVRGTSSYSSFAVVGEDKIAKGLETLVMENERVRKFGFTETELSRTLQNMLKEYESYEKEKDKTESQSYTSEYVNHFLEEEPSPGITYEFEFLQQIAPTITVDEINALATQYITDENRVILVNGIDKEGVSLPSEEEVLAMVNNVDLSSITAYEDAVSDDPLLPALPSSGKVVSTETNETVETTELILSNGMRIVVKPTDFKNDEIQMSAFSRGGSSLYDDEVAPSATNASGVASVGGVGAFSAVELNKKLAGKNVSVRPYISTLQEGFSGYSTPEDLETLLQLTHLYFTQPRKDEEAFMGFMERNKTFLKNLEVNPNFYFQDQVSKIMSQNHPRGGGFPTEEELNSISQDKALDIYKERFANAGDFTFFFVGNINLEDATPLLEKYLGSLPGNDTKENFRDLGIRPPAGPLDEKIYKGVDEKSTVRLTFVGEKKLDGETRYQWRSLAEVVSNLLIEVLREDESGVYGAGASASATSFPYDNYRFNISFPCAPENVGRLVEAAINEVKKIQENGIEEDEIKKVQEGQIKNWEESLKQNRFWMSRLNSYYLNEGDLNNWYNYEKYVENLNSDDMKALANELIDLDKMIKIVLYPESEE
ncbi:MAG: insulinase family protein [Cytophagales bacterium]|nr:insulinase family protein [Cytophagales bacterium]